MKKLKRFSVSFAYIDGSRVFLHVVIGQLIALSFALLLNNIVNPWWLWLAISVVLLYQLAVFWLMRQFYDYGRSLGVFLFGVVCLGIVINSVTFITAVRLPTDLPIVMYLNGFYPFHTTTYDPGSVAVYYASFAQVVALLVVMTAGILEDWAPLNRKLKIRFLDRLDLIADIGLDELSFYLNKSSYSWGVLLVAVSAVTVGVIVGSAALLL